MDAYRRGRLLFMHFDVPGIDPDAIELTLDDDRLRVRARRVWADEEGDVLVARERPQGTFERTVHLGAALDRDHVEARCAHGVLTIRVPVLEAAEPHTIPITVVAAGEATDRDTATPASAA
jgi:HSP20 family protein